MSAKMIWFIGTIGWGLAAWMSMAFMTVVLAKQFPEFWHWLEWCVNGYGIVQIYVLAQWRIRLYALLFKDK